MEMVPVNYHILTGTVSINDSSLTWTVLSITTYLQGPFRPPDPTKFFILMVWTVDLDVEEFCKSDNRGLNNSKKSCGCLPPLPLTL